MSLAVIRYEENDGRNLHFQIDIGKNRYYAYTIGHRDERARNGIALLDAPVFESPIYGPVAQDDGRAEIAVPAEQFGRQARFIQLHSYRDRDGSGPAVSAILETESGTGDDQTLGAMSMSRSAAMTQTGRASTSVERRLHKKRACRIVETQSLSTAQFIDALVSMLPQLLPAAGSIIGALMGGNAGTRPGRSTPASPATAPPPWAGQLVALVQQLLQSSTATARAASPGTTVTVTGEQPAAASLHLTQHRHSEAMFAPALLAALPALAPLLQQVLNPQTIQSVLQTADPNRLIGTISNAINSFAQLGMQNTEAQRAHLRALNPGVDDPLLMGLLAQMSANLERVQSDGPAYRRTEKAKLHFADTSTVSLGGSQVVAYLPDNGLQFPLSLETGKPVPPGWMRVTIQHADTLARVARFRTKTPPLGEGRLGVVPAFKPEELTGLKLGHDYLVKAELIWKAKDEQRIGVTTTQGIRILGRHVFDSVRDGREVIPLNNVDIYRDFWHKVWQDSFTKEVARREYECKYYYLIDPAATSNAQAKTRLREAEDGIRKVTGRIQAGLLLSLNRLNELLPQLHGGNPLSEAELEALRDPRFVERLSLAARYHAKFGGRPERPAALWVFPEVKVHRVLLRECAHVEASGHVVSLSDHEVNFPIPVLVHFVGLEGE